MKIHAIQTGAVRLKHGFLFPRDGARRQLDLFLPGPFLGADADPLLGDRARRSPAARRHR